MQAILMKMRSHEMMLAEKFKDYFESNFMGCRGIR